MYQMIILLMFNKAPNWTVKGMLDETRIEPELLFEVLYDLLKRKLLVCAEINKDKFRKTDIEMHYIIEVADNYKR